MTNLGTDQTQELTDRELDMVAGGWSASVYNDAQAGLALGQALGGALGGPQGRLAGGAVGEVLGAYAGMIQGFFH